MAIAMAPPSQPPCGQVMTDPAAALFVQYTPASSTAMLVGIVCPEAITMGGQAASSHAGEGSASVADGASIAGAGASIAPSPPASRAISDPPPKPSYDV